MKKLFLLVLLVLAVVSQSADDGAVKHSTVCTAHFSLTLTEISHSRSASDGAANFQLTVVAKDGNEVIAQAPLDGFFGLASFFVNGKEERVVEFCHDNMAVILFPMSYWLGYRTFVGVLHLTRTQGHWHLTSKTHLIIYYDELVIRGERLAYCDGWTFPDENDLQFVEATVYDLISNKAVRCCVQVRGTDCKRLQRWQDLSGDEYHCDTPWHHVLRAQLAGLLAKNASGK